MDSFWKKFIFAVLVLTSLLCSCKKENIHGTSNKDSHLSLEKVDTIQIIESDSAYIGDFIMIDIHEETGDIYVPDFLEKKIVVLDSTGNIYRVFGSPGEGPGELTFPMGVLVKDDYIFIEEDQRISKFSLDGTYQDRFNFPENVYNEDLWSLNSYKDKFYIGAVDISSFSMPSHYALTMNTTSTTVVEMDNDFEMIKSFGSYPELYNNGEYTWKRRDIAISGMGKLAAVFELVPAIYVYDLNNEHRAVEKVIDFDHPSFRGIKEETPIGTSRFKKVDILLNISLNGSVAWLDDEHIAVAFTNRRKDYFINNRDERDIDSYLVVAHVQRGQIGYITLPGILLAVDKKGRLYIKMSNIPDEREIGVFRLMLYSGSSSN